MHTSQDNNHSVVFRAFKRALFLTSFSDENTEAQSLWVAVESHTCKWQSQDSNTRSEALQAALCYTTSEIRFHVTTPISGICGKSDDLVILIPHFVMTSGGLEG